MRRLLHWLFSSWSGRSTSSMAGHFRSSVWDPVLIIAQIVTMQSVFYVGLGIWIFVIDFILGTYRSTDQLFSYQEMQFKLLQGKLVMMAYALNALTGSLGLWYVVQRTKQCLDFTFTAHFIHLIVCWAFNGHFPSWVSWWLINLISIVIMTVTAEFLCMRTELRAIPLGMTPKVDL